MLDEVLEFLGKLIAGGVGLGQDYGRLDDHSADRVGDSGDGALQHGRVHHEDALDLERTYAVAAGLDDVVVAADVPVVAVLVAVGGVAGVVHSIVPRLVRQLLAVVVAAEQSRRVAVLTANDDLADLAHRNGVPVGVHQIHVVKGRGLAHASGLGDHAGDVREDRGGFRLTESLHQLYAGVFIPLVEHLGVQRLACYGAVLQAGQVVFADALLDEEPEHCRGSAECGYPVLLHYLQHVLGNELVEVIHENAGAHCHLTVQLAPRRFSPAGVADGEVYSVGVHVLPVLCGLDMRQTVGVVVHDHLRVAGGAGGEVQQVEFVRAGGDSLHGVGVLHDFAVEVVPALVSSVHDRLHAQVAVAQQFVRLVDVVRHLSVRGRNDCGHVRRLEAVLEVLCGEHVCRRNSDRAQLHQSQDSVPVLVVALEHEHYLVALLDTPAAEHVRRPGGEPGQVAVGEQLLVALEVNVHQGAAVRLHLAVLVDDVVGVVEVLGVLYPEFREHSVFVVFLLDEIEVVRWDIHVHSFPGVSFYGINKCRRTILQIPETISGIMYSADLSAKFRCWDSIGKPSSVVYDHLSRRNVAITLKPPFNEARRADA